MGGTPRHQPPRSMMWLALAIALVIAILMFASGCARPHVPSPAAKSITFAAASSGGSVLVVVDILFAPGVSSTGTTYPHEWATTTPFVHVHVADPGTVIHSSIKVYATEPGQTVSCKILINAEPVDLAKLTKNYAVCIGPPV